MDRILADDFILVTGKGVVHTKAELLEEARARTSSTSTRRTPSRRSACGGARRWSRPCSG
jgi:hypothetical protein